jgi:hypothetical protein
LRATDLLLQSGGFGFIALDLSDVSREVVRHVPLDAWFRFRRAVEDTQTILVVMEQESNAKTCASLVLHLEGEAGRWAENSRQAILRNPFPRHTDSHYGLSRLLSGFDVRAEVLRSRVQPVLRTTFRDGLAAAKASGRSEIFETHAPWNYSIGARSELKPR